MNRLLSAASLTATFFVVAARLIQANY